MAARTAAEGGGPVDAAGEGQLFLCATPIGNLADVTLRALDVLGRADLILAEDTRQTAKLLRHHGIDRPLLSFHDHNESARLPRVLELLEQGQQVVLVSDAGSPLVADPGFRLVREAIARGLPVTALPGPSAVLPAIALSGLPPYPFLFVGFLPRRPGPRRRLLASLGGQPWTLVFFESPHRLVASLTDIRDALGAGRPVAVARELTKRFEEVVRGTVEEVLTRFSREAPRGELVVVVGRAGDDGAAAGPGE